jgi:uncharacterized membrane-anchored protein YhcB (DUF1043 family)
MIFILSVLIVTFLVGVLIGSSLNQRALDSRTRRQAAMQRVLNAQWQQLEAARQAIAINGSKESHRVHSA